MEHIFECYGGLLLDACAMAMLLLLVFGLSDPEGNRGVLNMIGAQLPAAGSWDSHSIDFQEFRKECEREAPAILYMKHGPVSTGRWMVSELIKAYDASGKEIPVRIQEVRGPDGVEVTESCDGETTELDFMHAGIYSFIVSASDARRKKSVCEIRIPVNV